jgi:membrane protein DedA with SNARE-associated domain
MQIAFTWLAHFGYPALFGLLVLGIVGLPVPDETLLTFCGYLVYSGRLHPGWTFATAFCGSTCGITISYFLGAHWGNKAITRFGKYIYATPKRVRRAEQMFHRFGPMLLTGGYFIPGVRHFTAIVAGISAVPYPKFALFAYSGAAIWVTLFLSLGYFFGERWQHTSEVFHHYLLIAIAALALLAAIIWLIRRLRVDPKKAARLQ